MTTRPEHAGDEAAVFAVHAAAFPTEAEARLVDSLRAAGRLAVSRVAEEAGRVVGHVAFSPVSVGGVPCGLGLAPLAVLPEARRRGAGAALVRDGLAACAAAGAGLVVVLGHPAYYGRFGFRPASALGLGNEYGAGDEFMALELRPGAAPAGGGPVTFAPEFAAVAAGGE